MATSTEKTVLFVVILIVVVFIFLGIFPFIMLRTTFWEGANHFVGMPFLFSHRFAPLIPFTLLCFLWLIVVVWVFRDAEKRGMSGILWGLLVFVGNFVGLLIYLIVRSDNLPAQMAAIATTACPGCGKAVEQTFDFCPHCGNKMRATCPSCEKPASSDWQNCPYCGHKLADQEAKT
jgi:hypothetical protein